MHRYKMVNMEFSLNVHLQNSLPLKHMYPKSVNTKSASLVSH